MEVKIVIAYNPWYQNSASANRWLTLIEGIVAIGLNPKLLIYGGYTSVEERKKFNVSGLFKNIHYEYLLPILLKGYWKVRFYNYIGNSFRNRLLVPELTRQINNENQIIWTDSSQFSFQIALVLRKKRPKIKLFLEMSEFLDIHLFSKGNFLQRIQGNAKQRLFENRAIFAYNGIALMTLTLFKYYQSFPNIKSNLLHLPMTVDLRRFDNLPLKLPEFILPYIAFVGVMDDAKDGVSILIKAFNLIKVKYPEHKIYLIGGWNYDTPYHLKLIEDLNMQDRVFWMREYNRNEIPNIICNADLLVLPRPESKQAQGGFPTKLGEYLATGNPVCSTSVGEIPNYLKDNESIFFAEPGSVKSFAEAMERALRDPENAKRVGANGKKVAEEHFNKDIQAKKLFDFLKELEKEDPRQK